MYVIKVKADTGLSCFEVEDFLLHNQTKGAVGRSLEGSDVGRMRFGNILGSVDFIVHDDQDTLVS